MEEVRSFQIRRMREEDRVEKTEEDAVLKIPLWGYKTDPILKERPEIKKGYS